MRRWLVYSNLHIVPVAAGFVLGTYALSGVSADPAYVVLATCGAFLIYQWDRVSGLSPEDHINVPGRRKWLLERPAYLVLSSALALSGALWGFVAGTETVRIAAVLLGGAGLVYAVPILWGRRPKEIAGIKNLLVAGSWMAGGVVVPLVDASAGGQVILWLGVYRLLYILPDLAAAESADRHGDIEAGVQGAWSAAVAAHPFGFAAGALVATIALSIWAVLAGPAAGHPSGARIVILLIVDLTGLAGAVWTLGRVERPNYDHVMVMDAWTAFPLITWVLSLFI